MNNELFIMNLCRLSKKTQREMAKDLGVSESLISHIRNGRRNVSDRLLIKMHRTYGFSIEELTNMLN